MGLIRRKVPQHYIEIHPDNIATRDWIILLEAGTIVAPSADKLRVAAATLEKKIVRKYNVFLRKRHFLVLDGYDPRIHTVYFCPQLYGLDNDRKIVPLAGEEIGALLARAVRDSVVEKLPWYDPSEKPPPKQTMVATMNVSLDSLVVDRPASSG